MNFVANPRVAHVYYCIHCSRSDGTSAPTSVLAIAALIVGLVAAGIALQSLHKTNEAVGMARAEHAEFMRQLAARADFAIELVVKGSTGLLIERWRPGEDMLVFFRLVITNTGNRSAELVDVRVLSHTRAAQMWWSSPDESPLGDDRRGDTDNADQQLPNGEWGVQALSYVAPVITRRTPLERYFALTLPQDMKRLDIVVKVDCDNLPDDRGLMGVPYIVRVADHLQNDDGGERRILYENE